jgi:NAD-dependent dihydropyrimidine dehydrogenase PreA subunit
MAFSPEVISENCVGCGECIDVCPVNIYELQDGKSVTINEEECIGCESCVEVCENDAITVTEY